VGVILGSEWGVAGAVARFGSASARTIDQLTRNCGLRDPLISNVSFSRHANRGHSPRFDFYFDTQLVTGHNGTPEAGAFDTGEHHQLAVSIVNFSQQ
jgi:hypothetical protein